MAPEALRVAALIDTWDVSGPGRQLAALAIALRDVGVHMRVFMFHRSGRPQSPYASYLAERNVDVRVLPDSGPTDLMILKHLGQELSAWTPHVVQTHSYRMTACAYILKRFGAKWPWAAFFHGTTTENVKVKLYHKLDRSLMKSADRLVVMSTWHKESFACINEKVRLIHNAAILPNDSGLRVYLPVPQPANLPKVGVVGRLSSEKGVDVFLQAVQLCHALGCTVAAYIAGDGPEKEALRQQAAELGISDHVYFLGPIANVNSIYSQLDLVAIPSRSEGLPNVLLEAMQFDVPVVATRVGAIPEVLSNPDAGAIVPAGDASALAVKILEMIDVGRHESARAARALTCAEFSLDQRVARHMSLYAELSSRFYQRAKECGRIAVSA